MTRLPRGDHQDVYRRKGGRLGRPRRSVNANVNGVLPRKHSGQVTPTVGGRGIRIVGEITMKNVLGEEHSWRRSAILILRAQHVILACGGIRIQERRMKILDGEIGTTRYEGGASAKLMTTPTTMRLGLWARKITSRSQELSLYLRVVHAVLSPTGPSQPHNRRHRLRHHRPQNPIDAHLVVARTVPGTAAAQGPERVRDHPRL